MKLVKRYSQWRTLLILSVLIPLSALGSATYRSIIEWNGPYFHVRHGLVPDSSAYFDFLTNNPLPLYSVPFSSPTAVETYGTATSLTAFVVDHDQRRVQTFLANASWRVEALSYSTTPVQGTFGGRYIKFTQGGILRKSERISLNGRFLKQVEDLSSYTSSDSVYTIVYDGVPNTGGVATMPSGWVLSGSDIVLVEYAYSTVVASPGVGDIDYILYQTTPTDIPLQLNEATSTTDPILTDLTSLTVNPSVRPGKVVDLYLVNGAGDGTGALASYDLSAIASGGVFNHVDTYPGVLSQPYDVEMVDRGINIDASVAEGVATGVNNSTLTESITNQNTFLAHNYLITFIFDTSTTMNQGAAPQNEETDLYFDPTTGRVHMVFCRDNATYGTSYSYSDNYGQTWSTPVCISPATLTAAHDNPVIAVASNGVIHVIYEAVNGSGDRHIYHTYSEEGVTWLGTTNLTSSITPATVTENRYPDLVIDPTDQAHVVWSGDDDLYYSMFTVSWSAPSLVATGAGGGFAAPNVIVDQSGRLYVAYNSDAAAAPYDISYIIYNGAQWGSYNGGGWMPNVPDPVTVNAGFANDGGGRGETFPFPQIAATGDTIWILWAGSGTETFGAGNSQLYFNRIASLGGDFTPGATAITTGDVVSPTRFTACSDDESNLHVLYGFASTVDREGVRYAVWDYATDTWDAAGTTGREIFAEGAAATAYALQPRIICPTINNRAVPFMSCGKAWTTIDAGVPRAVFKIIDGILKITDQTTLSEINQWAPWTHGEADTRTIPGLSFTISEPNINQSTVDDVDATNFNVGDTYVLTSTAGEKNDILFLTDRSAHRFKVIRAYENIDNCFAGNERWDVPGQSDGTPSQTYKLGTVGGEDSYVVYAGPDTARWTIVDNLLITAPNAHVCEVDRFTREVRFGDGVHGAIPTSGNFIRVKYDESVDEIDYGVQGTGLGQLNLPKGIAAQYNSSQGQYDVYVVDAGNHRLQKYGYKPDPGMFPYSWTWPVVAWNTANGASDVLLSPHDIELIMLDDDVYLVVSDAGNTRLVIYRDDAASGSGGNSPPTFVATVGNSGNLLNRFADPQGLAVAVEDSGLIIFAADADRDVVSKILSRDWLVRETSDTTSSGGDDLQVTQLSFVDALDNDNTLLLQPGAERIIQFIINRPDSVTAVKARGSFSSEMIEILSVTEGNIWSGENFTNRIFLYDVNNDDGTFEIDASMIGDTDGLVSSGSRVVANITVRARTTMIDLNNRQATGNLTLSTAGSEIRRHDNTRTTDYNSQNLSLRGGYLADIASSIEDPGTPPSMVPNPDGMIEFADVNVFTQGWNGDGITFDPISDIGPYLGTTLPNLIAAPDRQLDAYDLLSLTTMYNWYHSNFALSPPPPPGKGGGASSLDTRPLKVVGRYDTDGWLIEIQARQIQLLTSAHFVLTVEDPGAVVVNASAGDFLADNANLIFLRAVEEETVDICMGRLNP
ncbi:hypothetical protein KKG05_08280, partial [bacterium]|nr:hypothetical protein [bacterium]